MRPRNQAGLTMPEFLVVLVIVVFIALVLPWPLCTLSAGTLARAQMTQALSNMKQIHLATQQMVLDGDTVPDTNLRWPGDMGGTYTNWQAQVVPSYLTTNDLCKLLSVSGHIAPQGHLPMANTNAIRVYAVNSNSPVTAIFLATENISDTPQGPLLETNTRALFSNKGFVVFRKGGDGAILLPKQITNAAAVGTFVPLCQ